MKKSNQLKSEILQEIENAGKRYGTYEDVALIENAYQAGIPDQPCIWCALGYRLSDDNNEIFAVNVYWDFSEVPDYDKIDDASSLPWEDKDLMSADDNTRRVDSYDLTDADDIVRAANGIG